MSAFLQSDFSGGMNLLVSNIKLAENEYGIAYNVRNREMLLDPIAAPVEDTGLLVGKKQGIYAFDAFIIAFVDGHAYYKNIVTDSVWTQIANFIMSPNVDYFYVQAVPASKINYERKLANADQITGNSTTPEVLTTNTTINGTPAGLIVQDGITQPWLILPNGTARKLQTFEEWTTSEREYVPIMKQMALVGGILFGVAKDGKTIYRSVSGRPLDFVVNVTALGDKGGDASTTSHAVGFDELTCLLPLPTGELLVGSQSSLHPLTLNYQKTIFGEPTFLDLRPLSVGIVNQFSYLNILSKDGYTTDGYFIDFDGMRTFNASLIDNNEGRNDTFSSMINEVLVPKQTITCAIHFDNYSFMSVKTTLKDHNLVAVYDNITKRYVCFDDYAIGTIKQFAVANQSQNPTIYAITSENKIYKLFSSSEVSPASVSLSGKNTQTSSTQIRLENIGVVFIDGTTSGTVTATEYPNGYASGIVNQSLVGLKTENRLLNFLAVSKQCWRCPVVLSWNNNSKLALVEMNTQLIKGVNIQNQAQVYATN